MKITQRWTTRATLVSMLAAFAALLTICSCAPRGGASASATATTRDGKDRAVEGEDELLLEKAASSPGAQKITLTLRPPPTEGVTRGALDHHRVFITFEKEQVNDTVTAEIISQPTDKKKKLLVTLSTPTPSPVTRTTGPHPVTMTLEAGTHP